MTIETDLRDRLARAEDTIRSLANAAAAAAICVDNCDFCRQVVTEGLEIAEQLYPHLDYVHYGVPVDPDVVRRHLFELSHYWSTWCWHGRHEQCKGHCKMVDFDECDRQCSCYCHTATT